MPELPPADELLITRLAPPPLRPALVERRRLRDELRAALLRPLTLIIAPAGAGKTTALAQALLEAQEAAGGPAPTVAWLSLDAGDNDPARFWRYVLAALGHALPGAWSRAEAVLRATAARPPEPLATAVLNAAAQLARPLILALDDYHLIEAPSIHAGIALLIERAPPQLRLALATRTPPPLPLASFAVRGHLAELRPAELRFTVAEAELLFSQTLGLPLKPAAVRALVERTEGWGAGLILAALAARGRADPAAFAASFSGASPAMLDYVAAEILGRQPPELRAFLLATAPLPRFSAELCDAVRAPAGPEAAGPASQDARPSSAALLARLEAANLFLVPLDDERRWFRYHHLFAEVLRAYLERTAPAALQATRARAAAWLAARGAYGEAIDLALAAEAWAQAADLVGRVGRDALLRSEVETLTGWLAALPPAVVAADSRLLLLEGWVRVLHSDLEGAEARAAAVDPGDPELQSEAAMLRTTVAVLRGHHHGAGAVPPADGTASPFLRAMAALNRGFLAQYTGDIAVALAAFAEVARAGEAEGNGLLAFIARCQAGEVQLLQGRPRAAVASYEAALAPFGQNGGAPAPFADAALVGLGSAAYELGEHGRAASQIEAGLSRRSVLGELAAVDGLQRLAAIAALRGDRGAATEHLRAAEGIARDLGLGAFAAHVGATRARLALRLGDLETAAAWLASPEAVAGPEDPLLSAETLALARADVLLALGRPAEALALSEGVATAAAAGDRGRHVAEAHLLRARALASLGRNTQARAALAAARAIAEPHGLVAVFLELGGDHAAAAAGPEGGAGPDELTEREVEVLRLVAAGLSNGEIAGRLVVAPATVKKHINRIFAKLDARSRTQALVRARERGVRV